MLFIIITMVVKIKYTGEVPTNVENKRREKLRDMRYKIKNKGGVTRAELIPELKKIATHLTKEFGKGEYRIGVSVDGNDRWRPADMTILGEGDLNVYDPSTYDTSLDSNKWMENYRIHQFMIVLARV